MSRNNARQQLQTLNLNLIHLHCSHGVRLTSWDSCKKWQSLQTQKTTRFIRHGHSGLSGKSQPVITLLNKLTLNTSSSPKGASTSDFFANLRQICVVKTIKAFWCVFNNLSTVDQLRERESYHLMRDTNRRPVWCVSISIYHLTLITPLPPPPPPPPPI